MKQAVLQVRFYGYWHCGSGEGGGPAIDRAVVRDGDGLPFVPGRTLKGALRAGLEQCVFAGLADPATVERLMGTRRMDVADSDGAGEVPDRYLTAPGMLYIGDAGLPAAEREWFLSHQGDDRAAALRALFTVLPQTAIDRETGTARDHTLRSTEVALPMTLEATVRCPAGHFEAVAPVLRQAAALVRHIGVGRHRGLGRLTLTLTEAK